jgi:flagellar motility protein MotE (MotC chaperone)
MKKIFNLFLWFCAATVIAQCCILTLSAIGGNLNRQSIVRVIAILNGIDIQGKRLEQSLIAARQAPVATYEEILAERARAAIEIDSRESALNRYAEQLDTMQDKLISERAQFDRRRLSFDQKLNQLASDGQKESLKEVQQILENLQPEQSKGQLLRMLENNQTEDVVAIVKGMPSDKRKKILGEFASTEEASKLYEILQELRNGEPMASTIDQVRGSQPIGDQ